MRFNEAKATQAAARLLRNRGGRMSYMKLIKLLYLADREALARWGRPITTDSYVSMKHGPVLEWESLNLITDPDDPSQVQTAWSKHISAPENYDVVLKEDSSGDLLSEVEEMNSSMARFPGKIRPHQSMESGRFRSHASRMERPRRKRTSNRISRNPDRPKKEAKKKFQAIENELKSLAELDYYLAAR